MCYLVTIVKATKQADDTTSQRSVDFSDIGSLISETVSYEVPLTGPPRPVRPKPSEVTGTDMRLDEPGVPIPVEWLGVEGGTKNTQPNWDVWVMSEELGRPALTVRNSPGVKPDFRTATRTVKLELKEFHFSFLPGVRTVDSDRNENGVFHLG